MKILQRIIIFSLLFYFISCACYNITYEFNIDDIDKIEEMMEKGHYESIDDSASVTNCNNRQFSEDEIKRGSNYKCCFVKGKCTHYDPDDNKKITTNFQNSIPISKSYYDNIDKDEDEVLGSQYDDCTDLELDCSGSSLSHLYLVFILLILF